MPDLFTVGTPEGLIRPGNIDLSKRPVVKNADGSISTVRSMSVGMDGVEYLIPTVAENGKILSDEEAIKEFQRTGKHLGIFADSALATKYAKALHDQQAADYLPLQKGLATTPGLLDLSRGLGKK